MKKKPQICHKLLMIDYPINVYFCTPYHRHMTNQTRWMLALLGVHCIPGSKKKIIVAMKTVLYISSCGIVALYGPFFLWSSQKKKKKKRDHKGLRFRS
jgi:hypothetical protein